MWARWCVVTNEFPDPRRDFVTFEPAAFARGRSLLFRLGSPIARRKQLALGAAYVAARRAVG